MLPPPQPQGNPEGAAVSLGASSGAKAQDLIVLEAPEVEKSVAYASRSPPLASDDFLPAAAKAADEIIPMLAMTSNILHLEDAGMMLLLKDSFSCPSCKPCVPFTNVFHFRVDFSSQDSSHFERQG
jgi:hypothetical protein